MKIIGQIVILALFVASGTSKGIAQIISTPPKPLPLWAPDSSCMQEFERTTKHSARCQEQLEYAKKRMDEETKKCTDAMKKVYGVCGIGPDADYACYKKYRANLEAACGEHG